MVVELTNETTILYIITEVQATQEEVCREEVEEECTDHYGQIKTYKSMKFLGKDNKNILTFMECYGVTVEFTVKDFKE
jgi:hypothetical protein